MLNDHIMSSLRQLWARTRAAGFVPATNIANAVIHKSRFIAPLLPRNAVDG